MSSSRSLRRKSRIKRPSGNGWTLTLHLVRLLTIGATVAALPLDPVKGADTIRLLRRLIELLVAGM